MTKKTVVFILAGMLLLCGCASRPGSVADAASLPDEAKGKSEGDAQGAPGGANGYYGMLFAGQGQRISFDGEETAAEGDANVALVSEGTMLLSGASLTKSGDATGTVASGGGNAAVAVLAGGQLTMENQCAVTTDGYGAHGLFASGANTYAESRDTSFLTTGTTSAGVYLREAGIASLTGGSVTTNAQDGTSPAFLLGGGGELMLNGVSVNSAGALAEVTDGKPEILASNQILSGNITLAEGAGIRLSLAEESAWTGTVEASMPEGISVSLDKSSLWTLTADTTVDAFTDGDETLSNIHSNGFTLYYNASNEENAWLSGQAKELPEGGFLTPMI